jgi:hypothetical protein
VSQFGLCKSARLRTLFNMCILESRRIEVGCKREVWKESGDSSKARVLSVGERQERVRERHTSTVFDLESSS